MNIDREAVRARAAQFAPRRQGGVAGLLSGIHRDGALRGWLTAESLALPPVPEFGGKGWTLTSLVAAGRREPQTPVLKVLPAWGAVRWEWPSQEVLSTVRLSELPAVARVLEAPVDPAAWHLSMKAEALGARGRFFQTLSRFVSEDRDGEQPDLSKLTRAYAQVLPRAAYPVYHALVPSSRAWLVLESGAAPNGAATGGGGTAAAARESAPRSVKPAGDADSGTSGPPRPSGGSPTPAGVRAASGHGAAEAGGGGPVPQGTGPTTGGPAGATSPADSTGPATTSLVKTSSAELAARLGQARRLASDFGLEAVSAELERLRGRVRRPGFRIAVVGEFGRGKSTLVNRLLGQKVVPEGRHTRVPLVIAPGAQARLELQFADGRSEPRPPTQSSWDEVEDLSARGRLVGVRVLVEQTTLADLDLEIVDTPGVNAPGSAEAPGPAARGQNSRGQNSRGQAASPQGGTPQATGGSRTGSGPDTVEDLIRRTVAASDAVLMVVSASSPLGLSETSFLEEEVISRHVPRITVVASKLDSIDEDEREDIVDYLGGRLRRISPELQVLAGPHPDGGLDLVGPVRERIGAWTAEGGRRAVRTRQTTGQLLALLREMAETGRAGQATAELGDADRRRAVEEAEAEIDKMAGAWGTVRVELQARRGRTAEKFREHLAASHEDLTELLRYELERAPDPKTWWERDLPYRLRRELTTLGKKYEAQLHASVSTDLAWLDEQVQEHFGTGGVTQFKLQKAESLSTGFEVGEADGLGLKDLKSRKLAWRIGPSGVAVLGMLLIPLTGGAAALPMGLGMAASVGGMVLGEVKSTSLTDQQRAQAVTSLDPLVEDLLGRFSDEVAERLGTMYAGVVEEAVRVQRTWREDRRRVLASAGAQGPKWADLTGRAEALAARTAALLDVK